MSNTITLRVWIKALINFFPLPTLRGFFMCKKNVLQLIICGALCGFLNGFFGSGGGIVSVVFLRKIVSSEKQAHACSTFVMLLLSIVSLCLYWNGGFVDINQAIYFVPLGLVGSVVGAFFLKKIGSATLKKIFGAVLVVSGVLILLR